MPSAGNFSRRELTNPFEGSAWLLGQLAVDQQSWGGWESTTSNWLGMPCRLAGYGCSERIRITHGVNCLSKRQRKCKPSSRLRLTRGLEMVDRPCSGRIGGSTSRTLQPSHHICTRQFHLECVAGKLSERDCTTGLGCRALPLGYPLRRWWTTYTYGLQSTGSAQ
jgi:hypothetical protein